MAAIPIFATLEPLEKLSIYTPLGIRFWDQALDSAVVDGLVAAARPPGRPDLARSAFRTQSGIYAFNNLPGLRSLEASDPDLPAGVHPAPGAFPPARFIVEVHDQLRRFMDMAFHVDLPYRGIFPTVLPPGAPGPALKGFFLFSRLGRPVRAEVGVIQAQLVERVGPGKFRPAQHAILEVKASGGGNSQIGVSGEDGSVVVFFPYPVFDPAVVSASPSRATPESRLQGWDVVAQVHYRPATQTKLDTFAHTPDLGSLLNQPLARLWPDTTGPGQSQRLARLVYSQPLLLETAGTNELWVEVA